MKNMLAALGVSLAVTGCVTEPAVLTTGAIGAATGAIIADDDDELEGAVVGGLVGAAAGALLVGPSVDRDRCIFEDRYGREFIDDCPYGYDWYY